MIYLICAMIYVGVFVVQVTQSKGGFAHDIASTFGYGTLGCAAALVLS